MGSTRTKLLDYDELLDLRESGATLNPIDRFILDNEPVDPKEWRLQLLAAFNYKDTPDDVGDGFAEDMARRGWVKFNPYDESTYPPIGEPVVGYWDTPSVRTAVYTFRPQLGGLRLLGLPTYWCQRPDSNDFD